MRTTDAQTLAFLNARPGFATESRVWVRDSGGTERALTGNSGSPSTDVLGGRDWVQQVELSASLDDLLSELRLLVDREAEGKSLAPLMSAAPLLMPMRRVRVEMRIGASLHSSADAPAWGP